MPGKSGRGQGPRARAETTGEVRSRHLRAALYALGTTAVVLVTDPSIVQENRAAAYALTGLAFALALGFWEIVLVAVRRLRVGQRRGEGR
ncbi:hypothetical protein J4G33_12100 [Actinotalea sp. BY-33]|uniref:Uncharacterized protein n=1 Tax=Actinotalea soli TaxID=2819234 RepID=A0A939RVM4_9CELL|nr:hypothetical protein [Actinotalea soli]MBO1752545.1 hypothetical protein [Actinotalea soli]